MPYPCGSNYRNVKYTSWTMTVTVPDTSPRYSIVGCIGPSGYMGVSFLGRWLALSLKLLAVRHMLEFGTSYELLATLIDGSVISKVDIGLYCGHY